MQIGKIVKARVSTAVCDKGEYGVCYEVYELDGRLGCSVIFEKGRYDGFNPDEVGKMLTVLSSVAHDVGGYQFVNVTRLSADYWAGVFRNAFRLAAQHDRRHNIRQKMCVNCGVSLSGPSISHDRCYPCAEAARNRQSRESKARKTRVRTAQ